MVIPVAPGGTPRQLTNEAHAQAELGGSVFSPFDTAKVVQTDVTLTKAVDVTTPAPAMSSPSPSRWPTPAPPSLSETAVFITDPIPADTTFVSGSITADRRGYRSAPSIAAQNAVVWNAPVVPVREPPPRCHSRSGSTRRFRREPRFPTAAVTRAFQTPYFLSNEVEPVVQGPAADRRQEHRRQPHGGRTRRRIVTFQIRIDNTGTAAAGNLLLSDPFPLNAGLCRRFDDAGRSTRGPFTALTDANDGVEASGGDGRAFADRLEFRLASLGASQDVTLRFRVVVDPGTVGQFLFNQGVYASDETPSTDTNPVQVPIVGDAQVTGHVFLDARRRRGPGPRRAGHPERRRGGHRPHGRRPAGHHRRQRRLHGHRSAPDLAARLLPRRRSSRRLQRQRRLAAVGPRRGTSTASAPTPTPKPIRCRSRTIPSSARATSPCGFAA